MRRLLLPISLLYWIALLIRHKLYDWHFLRSTHFDAPVICVGNLSLGGTGKTPHTEYLIRLLASELRVATLSRGYGRTTRGWRLADPQCTASDIGDEPMQYHSKFSNLTVAVDEDRVDGVLRLLNLPTPPQAILLDDAFQHRRIDAGLNILITEYQYLYCNDYLVPAGRLRDLRRAAHRADILVVSKTPATLCATEKQHICQALKARKHQRVYFSTLEYEALKPLNEVAKAHKPQASDAVLLFTGIEHPAPLQQHLLSTFAKVEAMTFSDHHPFTETELEAIATRYATMQEKGKIIVTTEKDAARLANSAYLCHLESLPFYAAPIRVRFHEEEKFNEDIKDYVRQNSTDPCVSAPSHQRL